MDYGRLLAEAKGRREEGERGRRRVEGLKRRGKESREGGLLRRHQEVWERERARLRDAWKASQERKGGGRVGQVTLPSLVPSQVG